MSQRQWVRSPNPESLRANVIRLKSHSVTSPRDFPLPQTLLPAARRRPSGENTILFTRTVRRPGSSSRCFITLVDAVQWQEITGEAPPTKPPTAADYTKSGLPVEITAEFENWRRIRDSEGAEGWVYHSLLSGRRTAVVTTKSRDEFAPLHDRAEATSAIAARLESGVVANVRKCSGSWCRVSGTGFDGWIEQERLWGVYPEERVE